jgi:hypothetical protein
LLNLKTVSTFDRLLALNQAYIFYYNWRKSYNKTRLNLNVKYTRGLRTILSSLRAHGTLHSINTLTTINIHPLIIDIIAQITSSTCGIIYKSTRITLVKVNPLKSRRVKRLLNCVSL